MPNNVSLTIVAYIVTCLLVLIGHAVSSTGLDGPGLDALVLLIALITSISLIVRSIYKRIKHTGDGIFIFLHVAGLITLFLVAFAL
ncbi:hypothetical protein D0C36_16525 [Mucilaginibacter conchicola]|uniref:Uncharacterized protein n=1 Tax=Mucilaginibacter conchicola TaxID=2303333 RepID=A0A372NUQ5_9SPHI|nr:hypothetical protein [Mucilaginibacter conchicola]RFZ92990.1 hypothetical protein D0C36_16525 [Mucilaginibacter conchicola]